MRRNKAVGPDQIPIKSWRNLGAVGISWLTSLFNKIFTSVKMPEEWRLSDVIPIFKNNGDVQVCNNYRGIKLLSHTMKLCERVIERRLRRETLVRRRQSAPVRRVEVLVVDGMRGRDRPKLRWEDKVKLGMKELLLSKDMTSDRNEWRAKTSLRALLASALLALCLFFSFGLAFAC
uniref:Retrovirus-related Pol polyprotein LINE-1 n=1 Tax=Tanacetum cinerariifolium TaxID=118510 RepID=A0A699KHK7_TANCI|nr:retrovirus-related Pol polyprotein LINE-1 [Tanacetum cinerariifolium]